MQERSTGSVNFTNETFYRLIVVSSETVVGRKVCSLYLQLSVSAKVSKCTVDASNELGRQARTLGPRIGLLQDWIALL